MARIAPDQIGQFLGQTTLFRGCPAQILERIAPHLEQRRVPAGQPLVQAGTPTVTMGFLASGRASLRLVNAATGQETVLDQLQPGDSFGEIALLVGGVSPLMVITEDPSDVLLLRKEHFEQIISSVAVVAQSLSKQISQRFVRMNILGARADVAKPSAQFAPAGGSGKRETRFVEVSSFAITPQLLDVLPARLIMQHRMLPLEQRGKTLVLGMVNPFMLDAVQEIKRILAQVELDIVAISADDFNQAVIRFKLEPGAGAAALAQAGAGGGHGGRGRIVYLTESKKEVEKAQLVIGDEVISLLDRILIEAADRGASDVHIEPETSGVRVRYRVQGMLIERKETIPLSFAAPLAARVKVLAELDITERRLPQDGRIVAAVGKRELNFRISTMPTVRGEKTVFRLLDPNDVMRPLEQIFLDAQMVELAISSANLTHGAVIVAGPTGSGKSSTLYSMLNQRKISRPDNNIVTVEDPVEFSFAGLTQVTINPRVGLDFATVLHGLMRQDPDVILIGELRDAKTAEVAIEASLTGHLVLSSIHGSHALAVLQRLEHLGANPVLLSQAIQVIIVQRLSRRLCPSCVREEEVSQSLYDALVERNVIARGTATKLPRAVGCDACDKTGYRGRVPMIEMISFHDELRGLLALGKPPSEFLAVARASKSFFPFERCARYLMARKLLSPADALLAVAG